MRSDSTKFIWANRRRLFWLISLFTIALLVLLYCYRWVVGWRVPNLSTCTRLEVRYPRSTLDYFVRATALQQSILSPDERKHIQSIEFFAVNDIGSIKAFAHDVSQGSYDGYLWGRAFDADPVVSIIAYHDNKRVAAFTVLGDLIVTDDKRVFQYPRGLPNVKIIEPAQMQPFKLRFECALNMGRLYTSGALYRKKVTSYPQPSQWCDFVIRERTNRSYVSDGAMNSCFKCPAASEGKCSYAMNPDCEPDSPDDMVLLFETKAGWNQHGGRELFTFDNHEPKGGCVLLNDGTVKFIRTKEEFQQLHWK